MALDWEIRHGKGRRKNTSVWDPTECCFKSLPGILKKIFCCIVSIYFELISMFSDVRECFPQLNPFLCGQGRMGKTSNEGIVMVLPWNWLRTGASRVPCFLLFESLLTYLGIHQEETTNFPANVLGQQRTLPNLWTSALYSNADLTGQSQRTSNAVWSFHGTRQTGVLLPTLPFPVWTGENGKSK